MNLRLFHPRPSFGHRVDLKFRRWCWQARVGHRWIVRPALLLNCRQREGRIGGLFFQWWYGAGNGPWGRAKHWFLWLSWGMNNARQVRL